ncbi:carboxypeptidase-like regulatory domain-containing protein [Granulicella sp. S156]|uniref:carboxypeptidase-like regulatory domain-containing protein n=1 Tax=Granulicella sp. S156 TaxID=1747224 RepID=UPI00131E3086|nr:carboxypeptidase-like regulatory domain-containing protein [Granulicella sp. S156]
MRADHRFLCALSLCGLSVRMYAQQPSVLAFTQQVQGVSESGIRGTVKDIGGAAVSGAHITLAIGGSSAQREVITDNEGRFAFVGLAAGDFKLTIAEEGLASESIQGTLHPGEQYQAPPIVLRIATANAEVNVTMTREEIAEEDVKAEEKQRVFGIPNFFVTYQKNPVPLNARQKFELSIRGSIDPASFIISGLAAGIEQANNSLPGYGQGMEGYGKRFGAAYANTASATILRDGLFPALLHQDPRYFYRGTGSIWSRAGYALSTAVICKGDNGRWQPNYSSLLGNLSAGALTNLYYPAGSRNGAALTIENGLLGTAGVGVGHLIQEFVFSRITSHRHREEATHP